jgi:hypothetical protein
MMKNTEAILRKIKEVSKRRILFLPHAIRQMSRPERMVSTEDVKRIIAEGEMVEDYPDDIRGHSCLIMGFDEGGRPIHLLCAPRDDYLAIITAYRPSRLEWDKNFKTRKRK